MSASPPLKLVVMGTGPFAVPMFEALRRSPHRVLAVVTRPAHAAPGRRPPKNPMREAAQAAGVSVLDPERVNDDESVAAIEKLGADLFVVCDYGQILSPRPRSAASICMARSCRGIVARPRCNGRSSKGIRSRA
jgi:methionyl-tRNA formyltransferase